MTTADPEIAETGPDAPAEVLIGARLREASRIFHFRAPAGAENAPIYVGDYVVVDAGQGEALARVVTVAEPGEGPPPSRSTRPIIRLADAEDRERALESQRAADAILIDLRRAAAEEEMDLYAIAVQPNLDGTRATAHFQAEEHVDFRDLVEEMEEAHGIELKMQHAGPRDRAKLTDGHDICGLRLCCASWMTEFPKVGIRAAKDQDLSLNPDAISGVCGRILCCLTFEHQVYREMRGQLPKQGKRVSTPAGMGRVVKLNVLKQTATIALDDHAQRVDVPAAEIGLTVRTEDAPNQAAKDAERAERQRAAALRRAAAPEGAEIDARGGGRAGRGTRRAAAAPPPAGARSRSRGAIARAGAKRGSTAASAPQADPASSAGSGRSGCTARAAEAPPAREPRKRRAGERGAPAAPPTQASADGRGRRFERRRVARTAQVSGSRPQIWKR